MNPSSWPQLARYPFLRALVADRLDMQFTDLRTMLRLPRDELGLEAGCNLTTATLIFNVIAGSSVLFYEASPDSLSRRGNRSDRFKGLLVTYYPWSSDDLPREQAASALYDWARNPLAHTLGVGKDRRIFPGAPQVDGHPVALMLAKYPLDPDQLAVIATSRERDPALSPTVSLRGSELTVDVVTLAWGVHEMLRRLFDDEQEAMLAENAARELLHPGPDHP